MNNNSSPSIFSRLLLVVGGLAVMSTAYWFIKTGLSPIAVPPPSVSHGAVRFDPSLDISKNQAFFRLRALGPSELPMPELGRQNPFVPVPPPPSATSTATTTAVEPATFIPPPEEPVMSKASPDTL